MQNTKKIAGRSIDELLLNKVNREDMTKTEHKAFVEFWFETYESSGFCDTFQSPYESEKKFNGLKFEILSRCSEKENDLDVLPKWKIRFENGVLNAALPEEVCKLERNSTEAAEYVVTTLVRKARTADPVDYETLGKIMYEYGKDLYDKALKTVLAEINRATYLLKPCPVCQTAEYVYAIPSIQNENRFHCVCNCCGLGEKFPSYASEQDAEQAWNGNLEQLQKNYESFKLQWMIDHGFTLSDLVVQMEMMIHEDSSAPGVRTCLQSLFEDWEFGIGFNGVLWPCFEEFLTNDHTDCC